MIRTLDVYLNDTFVGALSQDDSGDLEFSYDHLYLENGDFGISLSLPLSAFSDEFFKGTYKGEK